MRGRRGGILGTDPSANYWGMSGLWRASEIYTLLRNSAWPGNTLSVSISPSYADATLDGLATFYAYASSTFQSVAKSWEKSVDDGQTWAVVSGETGDNLSLTSLTIANDGDLYRYVAVAGLRMARTTAVQVRFDTVAVTIDYHPDNQTVAAGNYAYIYVNASAIGNTYGAYYNPSYQWQSRENSNAAWVNMVGATSNYISILASSELSGRQYRAIATVGGSSATSNAATLTVT